ncbi:MAG: glycosyltransferase family 4 protein [Patescibacteria group bacterium]|jgi:glycosyltransferase involved in cell wall biosynthesis
MKIVFIGQKGIPAVSGGVEKHVEELSVRLVKLGHEVSVYVRPNYTDPGIKDFKGVNLISLPSVPTKRLDAITHTFFSCLHLIFFKRRTDIVHFHSIGPSSLIGLVKIFLPRTKVITTFHTQCYFHKKWSRLDGAYLKFGEWACHKFADEVIVVSKNLKNYSEKKYGRKVTYIPNGAEIKENSPVTEITSLGLQKEGYILAVSRLIRHKGVHHLIRAYGRISTDVKLVIVGDGFYTDNYVSELKKQAAGNPNIIFTGRQSGAVLDELFSNALFFVQPSESEGLSIALLEAMSFGLPVLTSDIAENLEAAEGAGYAFKNRDAEDLEKKLEFLLNPANRKAMKARGEKNRERIRDHYSWDKIAETTDELYATTGGRRELKNFFPLRIARKLLFFYR